VGVGLGLGVYDLYDAVSNQVLQSAVSGNTSLTVPADVARMIVVTPAGGAMTFKAGMTYVDGVVVDYRGAQPPDNLPPRIKALEAVPRTVSKGDSARVYCTAEDRDGDTVEYTWTSTGGAVAGTGSSITWTAPLEAGEYDVTCAAVDERGGRAEETITLMSLSNLAPEITVLSAEPSIIEAGGTSRLTCQAVDADDDPLTYSWLAASGQVSGEGSSVDWSGPAAPGYYMVYCVVDDSVGASATDSVGIVAGDLVGDYRFDGNALDQSGFGNHGTVQGVVLAPDRDGNPLSAYAFDGVDDVIVVPGHPSLDYQEAMTVAFWMQPDALPNRESFLISHGSWQNRWKVSIISDRRLRWTIKSRTAVKDLDSDRVLVQDSLYHAAVTYGEGGMRIYLDGRLESETTSIGPIALTAIDLTIGQMVPGDTQWNYSGVIDDVRIYNRVLAEAEIQELVGISTSIERSTEKPSSSRALHAPYPNPFSSSTVIPYEVSRGSYVRIEVFDLIGRRVRRLFEGEVREGRHHLEWYGQDDTGRPLPGGVYFIRLEYDGKAEHREVVRAGG
jgi:hypothetical protein